MKQWLRLTAPVVLVALVAFSLSSTAGCRRSGSKRTHRTISGTALNIDEATGRVSMRFFHKDSGSYRTVEGVVKPETEILINGRVAQLNEVRVNEEVVVTGYVEKEGGTRRVVATKIQVQRDEWSKGGATTKPAGKGDAKPAAEATPAAKDPPTAEGKAKPDAKKPAKPAAKE